jgi:nicotinate-nucleotide adenylyltransferase
MIKLAINDIPNLKVDEYESTTGKDINYSVDTIKHFKKVYPDAKLYFLIGADQVKEFHKWKSAEEISKMVDIVFFERPDITIENENIDKFHMLVLKGVFSYASATNIRDLIELDTPKAVLDYIANKKLYYIEKIASYLGEKRLAHSIEVAKLAYDIALSNGLDANKAYIAGILHDIGKEVEESKKQWLMSEKFAEFLDLPKFSYHQFVGEYIAKTNFNIKDEEILNAIKYHATGVKNISTLGKIIYAADKIEPTRGFDSSGLIKACLNDIEQGFIEVLSANKEYLTQMKKDINNRLTKECFEQYL